MGVREEYLEKAKAELADLARAGVTMSGNAFSQVMLLKGESEKDGAALLSARDGQALRAALGKLGYAPEDWVGLSSNGEGSRPLAPETLRLAIVTLDPSTVIALDEPAAAALREAFADELVELQDLDAATLAPGHIAQVQGMRVMALGGFEASLSDPKAKQVMWARLKRLPPLAEPY